MSRPDVVPFPSADWLKLLSLPVRRSILSAVAAKPFAPGRPYMRWLVAADPAYEIAVFTFETGAVSTVHTHGRSTAAYLVLGGSGTDTHFDPTGRAASVRALEPGSVHCVPVGIPHQLTAGLEGLVTLAVYAPRMGRDFDGDLGDALRKQVVDSPTAVAPA